jgi:hypothetical protein
MRDVFKDYVFFNHNVSIFLDIFYEMLRFFWISDRRSCDWRTFVFFFVDWGRKIGGVFFCGKWGAKAKRHGKNNHFYNAKSEAGVT